MVGIKRGLLPGRGASSAGRMTRVLFLFNHDAGHQVAHLASIAGEFARGSPNFETIIAYASADIRAQIEAVVSTRDWANVRWEELALPAWKSIVASLFDKILPATRLFRLRSHSRLFAGVDAIISTERTCLRLKKQLPQSTMPLFAVVPHGAGDRNVSYHPDFARFDSVLVAGQKVADQMMAHGVAQQDIEIVGYPKFEGIDLFARPDFFGNGKPTFVYNPHFDPNLSSWYTAGPDLLRWFASPEGSQFNCIFAPHVMLFKKRWHLSPEYRKLRRRPDLPVEALEAQNILIDTNSPRLFDMSYTLGADAYIGDASSQIYEFLARPRAAFFLETRTEFDPSEEEWHIFRGAGPVASTVQSLAPMLKEHLKIGEQFRCVQEELFRHTFDQGELPVSVRATKAIHDLLQGKGSRQELALC